MSVLGMEKEGVLGYRPELQQAVKASPPMRKAMDALSDAQSLCTRIAELRGRCLGDDPIFNEPICGSGEPIGVINDLSDRADLTAKMIAAANQALYEMAQALDVPMTN